MDASERRKLEAARRAELELADRIEAELHGKARLADLVDTEKGRIRADEEIRPPRD